MLKEERRRDGENEPDSKSKRETSGGKHRGGKSSSGKRGRRGVKSSGKERNQARKMKAWSLEKEEEERVLTKKAMEGENNVKNGEKEKLSSHKLPTNVSFSH